MSEVEKLRKALAKIAEIAGQYSALGKSGTRTYEENSEVPESDIDVPGCSIKRLPTRLMIQAASTAVRMNPVNAPQSQMGFVGGGGVLDPMQIAVMTAKYWGPKPRRLTVSFMESTTAALRNQILKYLQTWSKRSCVAFVETAGVGQVRISRQGTGFWSYLGTDVLHIPQNRPTMNLQNFTLQTPESEYKRVVQHEAGHTLGFPHEHMRKELIARIDRNKAYRYFQATQGWDQAMVDAQVLTPLDDNSIMGTPSDQTSIMCYQLPASITKDGRPIIGGVDINRTDFDFAGLIYPKPSSIPMNSTDDLDDSEWGEDEDSDPEFE